MQKLMVKVKDVSASQSSNSGSYSMLSKKENLGKPVEFTNEKVSKSSFSSEAIKSSEKEQKKS